MKYEYIQRGRDVVKLLATTSVFSLWLHISRILRGSTVFG